MAAPIGNNYAEGADGGRPSLYTQEVADVICEKIATSSLSLKSICQSDEYLPSAGTVLRWLREKEDFRNQYTRAKEEQADLLAEEILDIADDGKNDLMTIVKGDEAYEVENREVTSRSKLRVESRKWLASKLKPKKYGEKMDVTTGGDKLKGFEIIIDGLDSDKDN